jgi:hypothetical protein
MYCLARVPDNACLHVNPANTDSRRAILPMAEASIQYVT